jgi:hypothetical protein
LHHAGLFGCCVGCHIWWRSGSSDGF